MYVYLCLLFVIQNNTTHIPYFFFHIIIFQITITYITIVVGDDNDDDDDDEDPNSIYAWQRFRPEEKAATTIQFLYRCYFTRSRNLVLRRDIIHIQQYWRGYTTKKHYVKERELLVERAWQRRLRNMKEQQERRLTAEQSALGKEMGGEEMIVDCEKETNREMEVDLAPHDHDALYECVLDDDDSYIDMHREDGKSAEAAANNNDETTQHTAIKIKPRKKCRFVAVEKIIRERSHMNEFIDPNLNTARSDNEQKLANVGFSQENIARVRELDAEKKSSNTKNRIIFELFVIIVTSYL